MPRPIRARYDLSALGHNLAVVRRCAPQSRVWAVIKANAYGHSLLRAARALGASDGYALLDIAEALRLRDAGVTKPILLLEGCFQGEDITTAARHDLTVVVHHEGQLQMLERAAAAKPLEVYLKLNSGMNRLGFALPEAARVFARLRDSKAVAGITLMSHFADADGPSGIRWQLDALDAACKGLEAPHSLANSAAILRHPDAHADWVRPGIMLYGCSPFVDQSAADLGLRPVMTLASEIIGVQQINKGDTVGYGRTFTATQPMRIGVVACGYADGFPRHAPTGTPVLVGGRRTATVGRVSMDMLCVDLGALPEAGIGSPVTLWGEGLSADEVATACGTVSYELLCALAARVPQVELESAGDAHGQA
ncbi:MAG: alanine racemase [Betaproteobacteria bacterium]